MPEQPKQEVVIDSNSNVGSVTQIVRWSVPTILVIAVLVIAITVVSGYNLRLLTTTEATPMLMPSTVQTPFPTPLPTSTPIFSLTLTPTQMPIVTPTHIAFESSGRIAFTSGRDGHEDIYGIDVDGTNETRLTAV